MPIDFDHQTRTFLGLYELELHRFLLRYTRHPDSALDIGGQNGYDALVIAKLTGQRVASFEMDPRAAAKMRRTFALNPQLEPQLTVVEATVGAQSDQLGIDEWVYADDGFEPGLIKLDIEGGEYDALRSAERVLTQCRPNLLIETHSREQEALCGQLLMKYGYRPSIVHQRLLSPDFRPIPHNRWLVAGGQPHGVPCRSCAND
ncbi:MAG: FkbM family methyltransferase [Solirubrobacteraceae bacterium]